MQAMVITSLLTLAAAASVLLIAAPAARPSLRVGVRFTVAEGAALANRSVGFTAMAEEADAIWRPHGVAVRAVSLLSPAPPEHEDLRINVHLVARLDHDAGSATSLGAIVFHGEDGFEPTLRIAVSSVRALLKDYRFLGRPIAQWPEGAAGAIQWRALGRVLAHELGHYLVGLPAHRSGGLMRTGFDGHTLAAADRTALELDPIDLPRLRARIMQLVQRATLARLTQPD